MDARGRAGIVQCLMLVLLGAGPMGCETSAFRAWEVPEKGWRRLVVTGAHMGILVPATARVDSQAGPLFYVYSVVDSTPAGFARSVIYFGNNPDVRGGKEGFPRLADTTIGRCRARAGKATVGDSTWVEALVKAPGNHVAGYCHITSVLLRNRRWGETRLETMIGSLVQLRYRRLRDGLEVW